MNRATAAVSAAAALLAAGCWPAVTPTGPPPTSVAGFTALTITPETGQGTYQRAAFGQAWKDTDHNGCGQRDDTLARDLTDVTRQPGSRCIVVAGVLDDPYTGTVVRFEKAHAADVPIDHVVPLAEAWASGASLWAPADREKFANDLDNLQATTRAMNSAKRDADPAEWLPPNQGYRCTYVTRWVQVKTAYHLTVDQAEHDALARTLGQCP